MWRNVDKVEPLRRAKSRFIRLLAIPAHSASRPRWPRSDKLGGDRKVSIDPTRAELGIWNPLGVAQRGLHDAAVEPERRRLSRLHLAMDSKCTIRAPVNSSPGLF